MLSKRQHRGMWGRTRSPEASPPRGGGPGRRDPPPSAQGHIPRGRHGFPAVPTGRCSGGGGGQRGGDRAAVRPAGNPHAAPRPPGADAESTRDGSERRCWATACPPPHRRDNSLSRGGEVPVSEQHPMENGEQNWGVPRITGLNTPRFHRKVSFQIDVPSVKAILCGGLWG